MSIAAVAAQQSAAQKAATLTLAADNAASGVSGGERRNRIDGLDRGACNFAECSHQAFR